MSEMMPQTCHIKADQGGARYSQVQPCTAMYSQGQPGTAIVISAVLYVSMMPLLALICADEEWMFYLCDVRCRDYVVASCAAVINLNNGKEDDICICVNYFQRFC